MISLKDHVAVITGASRGIGRACALKLANLGAQVVVNYHHSEQEAEEVVKSIHQNNGKALAVRADVSKKEDCKALIDKTLQEFDKIDILVNNAGIHRESPPDEVDELIWNEIMDNNAKSVYMLSTLAGAAMKKQGRGVIINIGSVAGFFPRVLNTVYATSKGAIWTLTRGLALALAPEVRVVGVAPGRIETAMSPMENSEKRARVAQENLRHRKLRCVFGIG